MGALVGEALVERDLRSGMKELGYGLSSQFVRVDYLADRSNDFADRREILLDLICSELSAPPSNPVSLVDDSIAPFCEDIQL